MRLLALADTHLGLFLGRTAAAKKAMAHRAYLQLECCIDEAIHQDVDYIIHAGDIFNRSNPPKWVLEHYYQAIQRALEHDIKVMAVPGNHDRAKLDPSLLDWIYPQYRLFNRLDYLDQDGIRWIGVPFVSSDYARVWQQIRSWTLSSNLPVIIICHQLFQGASFGPHQYTFRDREDVFHMDLPDYAQVITGHIHRAQSLFDGKVIYTGSTIRTSFAELIEPKGYILMDVTSNSSEISFQQIPTQPMEVVEIDGRSLDLKQLDTIIESYSRHARILVRLLHRSVNQVLLRQLYQRYPAAQYPYLTFSPQKPDSKLGPRYGLYHKSFHFPNMSRSWTSPHTIHTAAKVYQTKSNF